MTWLECQKCKHIPVAMIRCVLNCCFLTVTVYFVIESEEQKNNLLWVYQKPLWEASNFNITIQKGVCMFWKLHYRISMWEIYKTSSMGFWPSKHQFHLFYIWKPTLCFVQQTAASLDKVKTLTNDLDYTHISLLIQTKSSEASESPSMAIS